MRRTSHCCPRRPTTWKPSFRPALRHEGRPAGLAGSKTRRHGLGEVPQRLLLHHLRARGQPRVVGAGGGKLSALLQVAGCALASRVPVLVLLDCEIPDIPGVSTMSLHRHFLGRCGDQSVSGHANIVANETDISGEVKRRSRPEPEAWALAPRSL